MKRRSWLQWTGLFLFFTVEITAVGALVGGLAFPLVGAIIGAERGWAELAVLGIRNIGFWFFIWAPAIALVRCVMRAHRERHPDIRA
jgi:hypothetical protein